MDEFDQEWEARMAHLRAPDLRITFKEVIGYAIGCVAVAHVLGLTVGLFGYIVAKALELTLLTQIFGWWVVISFITHFIFGWWTDRQ